MDAFPLRSADSFEGLSCMSNAFAFPQNPFERRKIGTEQETRLMDFKESLVLFERDCLFGKPEMPVAVEQRAKELKTHFSELTSEFGSLDYYVGAAWHQKSNDYRNDILDRKGSASLSVEQVDQAYEDLPDRKTLETLEDKALEQYRSSTKTYWDSLRQDQTDAQVLQNDLEFRMVSARLRGAEREEAQAKLMHQFEVLIDQMPTTGRQSELKFIFILRTCVLKRQTSHLVSIEHGLPSEDLSDKKVDVRLLLGLYDIPLQIKTEVTDDAYRREHYESVRAKAKGAIQGQSTQLLVLDHEDLNTAYMNWAKAGATKGDRISGAHAKKRVLDRLSALLPKDLPDLQSFFGLLSEPEKKEASSKGKRINADFLARQMGIPALVELGLLPQGSIDINELRRVREAMQSKLPQISKIFGSQEAFLERDPERVAQLKKLFK